MPAGVVDSHVHILPEPLASKIRAFFTDHLPSPLAYDIEPRSILERLAGAGVEEAWSLPYAHRPGIADPLNASMKELVDGLADAPVRLVAGLTVHPGDVDPLGTVVRGVDDLELKVLKLHCSVGDFSIADPRLDAVWEFAAERRLPVVVHVGASVSGRTQASELRALATTAGRHPQVVFVIAHCAYPASDEALEVMRRHPSVHADLTPVVDELVRWSDGTVHELSDRLLLGTDAPNTTIDASVVIASIRARFPGGLAEAILGGNARRLLAAVG